MRTHSICLLNSRQFCHYIIEIISKIVLRRVRNTTREYSHVQQDPATRSRKERGSNLPVTELRGLGTYPVYVLGCIRSLCRTECRKRDTIETSQHGILELHLDRETSPYCVPRGNRSSILKPSKEHAILLPYKII